MPSARLIGVGVFVIGGLLIFALGLFMIGDRRSLFADLFVVNAEFAQVAGLRDGAAVRVNGMEAGEVTDILIPASPAGRFRVRTPKLPISVNGAGDAIAALFFAHYLRTGSAAEALSRAASSIFGLLKRTADAGSREILLIDAQDEFVNPSRVFAADSI